MSLALKTSNMSPTLEFLRPGETKVIILLIGVQIKDLKMKSTTQMHDETDELINIQKHMQIQKKTSADRIQSR